MIFTASLLTGTKHSAFSINHLTDTKKTDYNKNNTQKPLNNQVRKLLAYEQTK